MLLKDNLFLSQKCDTFYKNLTPQKKTLKMMYIAIWVLCKQY